MEADNFSPSTSPPVRAATYGPSSFSIGPTSFPAQSPSLPLLPGIERARAQSGRLPAGSPPPSPTVRRRAAETPPAAAIPNPDPPGDTSNAVSRKTHLEVLHKDRDAEGSRQGTSHVPCLRAEGSDLMARVVKTTSNRQIMSDAAAKDAAPVASDRGAVSHAQAEDSDAVKAASTVSDGNSSGAGVQRRRTRKLERQSSDGSVHECVQRIERRISSGLSEPTQRRKSSGVARSASGVALAEQGGATVASSPRLRETSPRVRETVSALERRSSLNEAGSCAAAGGSKESLGEVADLSLPRVRDTIHELERRASSGLAASLSAADAAAPGAGAAPNAACASSKTPSAEMARGDPAAPAPAATTPNAANAADDAFTRCGSGAQHPVGRADVRPEGKSPSLLDAIGNMLAAASRSITRTWQDASGANSKTSSESMRTGPVSSTGSQS